MRLCAVCEDWKGNPTLEWVEVVKETATGYWTKNSGLAFGCRSRHPKTTPQTPEAAWALYRERLEAKIASAREMIRRAEASLSKIPSGVAE